MAHEFSDDQFRVGVSLRGRFWLCELRGSNQQFGNRRNPITAEECKLQRLCISERKFEFGKISLNETGVVVGHGLARGGMESFAEFLETVIAIIHSDKGIDDKQEKEIIVVPWPKRPNRCAGQKKSLVVIEACCDIFHCNNSLQFYPEIQNEV